MRCPLCLSDSSELLFRTGAGTRYYVCSRCDLRFLDPENRLSEDQERAQYLLHNNDVADPRYQDFVRPLYSEIRSRVAAGAQGLDFGAGTGPVLAEMLEKDSYRVSRYDPFFWPDKAPLAESYDFIFACEVAEHFHAPADELSRLRSLLRPGGVLAIMTLLYSGSDFSTWHYWRDPTHVVFYSRATFRWIADSMSFTTLEFPSDRIVILGK